MNDRVVRRSFLKQSAGFAAAATFAWLSGVVPAAEQKSPPFQISLAEWSLHRALFKKELDNLDFARTAKKDYGIEAIEFVNQFFKDKAKDREYLSELKKRADDLG